MSYDGIVMKSVAFELQQALGGARFDKIYQPNKNEICLVLRQPGHTHRLLLSSAAQEAGVYLTTQKRDNPAQAPLFCMVLRKHLEGGKILAVIQRDLERLLEITCESIDELGDVVQRKIIVEIMGKHSNIILVEPGENRIIDAIQRITPALSRYRLVLPGQAYVPPPPQNKSHPSDTDAEAFTDRIMSCPLTQPINKALLATFSGMGPQTINELIIRAGLEPSLQIEYFGEYELTKLWRAFAQVADDIARNKYAPQVIIQDNTPVTFSAVALTSFPAEMRLDFSTMNEALDYFYSHKKTESLYQQKKAGLTGLIQKEIDRCEKKAGLQLDTIRKKDESAHYRLWGELLTANIYSLLPASFVEVPNFYDPEANPVRIPLDESLSIAENAQHYFLRFQKARHAAKQAQSYYAETVEELSYLYSLANSLENVTTFAETEEIREEMVEAGYLKSQQQKPDSGKRKNKSGKKPNSKTVKAAVQTASVPQKITLDNWEIYIGKNNRQNDLLVTKIAKSEDIWLHTKDIPGSHVVIKNPQNLTIPDHILEQAALLAAFHSRSRLSLNVPVDYTQKKHVRKQKGAKPGMVNYDNQHTIYITPNAERVKSLLEKASVPTP